MPRPKPLVALHGSVNFDKLVPFDSAPNAPPLANNDILVMRKAAGGDNLTLSISDINATGSVNIAQLVGGVNNDMLYRVGGVWTGTGPTGLSYEGTILGLDGDALMLIGGGAISVDDTGSIEVIGSGNIEQSGTGNIEISGGGSLMVSNDGNIEIEGANAQVILSNGAEMAFEGGAGIVLENGAEINFDGDGDIDFDGNAGNIIMGSGQILAADGSAASPSYSFAGQPTVGFSAPTTNAVGLALGGVAQNTWEFTLAGISGIGSDRPSMRNVSVSNTVPGLTPRNDDSNTGMGRNNPDELSLIGGGVEGFRVAESGGVITNTIFGDLVAAGGGGAGPAMLNVGASATNPPFLPNQADPGTGYTRSGLDQLSHVGNFIETLRVRASTAFIAANSNLLVWDYDNAGLTFLQFGADNSAGAGFKTVRVVN